ncbi:GIY-YIG nuclease family protein [Sinorhizobium medicae]|uniref:GIY-YIG nuclease family protein n=1 Tax=Sinorhizobium medicae TaxID=110321 RepID=UPI002B1BD7BB|nr:GIY-YIG nuclease family protein [Sinorhizobium medicae]WQO45910.1 GIY-YIG nuclease family protein [Sinorhizobium medicae]
MSDLDLDELRSELDDFAQLEKKGGRSARDERIIAGFEDIQRFVEKHGRAPQHGEDRDIFERLYAVRLDRLRALEECRSLLAAFDHQSLLTGAGIAAAEPVESMDDDELLSELEGAAGASEITALRHVRASAEKRAAEEIANREKCEDFDRFKPLFEQVQNELEAGIRSTRKFVKDAGFLKADIVQGNFFILGGQTAYVADVGETFKAPNGEFDSRLRVVYSNGTESNLLRRSLQRALYKDEAGRRISEPVAGPLFADETGDDDQASGTIYVLRSKSDHPVVVANHNVLHKIGVTGGEVARRLINAKLDPTFLMADVEIIATYELYNISRTRLENLIHRIFDPARLDIEIKDRFGQPVIPREWFLVPLFVINEAVDMIKDGTITGFRYDPKAAALVRADGH